MSGTVLKYFTQIISLSSLYLYPHFMDEENEPEKGKETCRRLPTWRVAEPGYPAASHKSQPTAHVPSQCGPRPG